WVTSVSAGMYIQWGLGIGTTYAQTPGAWGSFTAPIGVTGEVNVVATNGATFDLTSVDLKAGSTYYPYVGRSLSDDLILCQRYFEKSYDLATVPGTVNFYGVVENVFQASSMTVIGCAFSFKVRKRQNGATLVIYSPNTGAANKAYESYLSSADITPTVRTAGEMGSSMYISFPVQNGGGTQFHWTASSELSSMTTRVKQSMI